MLFNRKRVKLVASGVHKLGPGTDRAWKPYCHHCLYSQPSSPMQSALWGTHQFYGIKAHQFRTYSSIRHCLLSNWCSDHHSGRGVNIISTEIVGSEWETWENFATARTGLTKIKPGPNKILAVWPDLACTGFLKPLTEPSSLCNNYSSPTRIV